MVLGATEGQGPVLGTGGQCWAQGASTAAPRWGWGFCRRRQPSPGYGTLPLVVSSVKRMPKDQTSDLMVNLPYRAASGAVHLMGNLAPGWRGRVRVCPKPHGAQGRVRLQVAPGPLSNQGHAPAGDATHNPGDQGPVVLAPVPPAWGALGTHLAEPCTHCPR